MTNFWGDLGLGVGYGATKAGLALAPISEEEKAAAQVAVDAGFATAAFATGSVAMGVGASISASATLQRQAADALGVDGDHLAFRMMDTAAQATGTVLSGGGTAVALLQSGVEGASSIGADIAQELGAGEVAVGLAAANSLVALDADVLAGKAIGGAVGAGVGLGLEVATNPDATDMGRVQAVVTGTGLGASVGGAAASVPASTGPVTSRSASSASPGQGSMVSEAAAGFMASTSRPPQSGSPASAPHGSGNTPNRSGIENAGLISASFDVLLKAGLAAAVGEVARSHGGEPSAMDSMAAVQAVGVRPFTETALEGGEMSRVHVAASADLGAAGVRLGAFVADEKAEALGRSIQARSGRPPPAGPAAASLSAHRLGEQARAAEMQDRIDEMRAGSRRLREAADVSRATALIRGDR